MGKVDLLIDLLIRCQHHAEEYEVHSSAPDHVTDVDGT